MTRSVQLRPFVPAKDYAMSRRFYAALGFVTGHADDEVTFLSSGSCSFILQNYYHKDFAENCMVQLVVEDIDEWWAEYATPELASEFAVQQPKSPAVQSWGLKVGFIWDPSGVLWHITQRPA